MTVDIADVDTTFPNNVLNSLATRFATIAGIEHVYRRPLRPVDPSYSIGVTSADWLPASGPEMGGHKNPDPLLGRYQYSIQCFVKHTNIDEGLRKHAYLSKLIRLMLYRDTTLAVALRGLSETSLGVTERVQKWGVRTQRYMSNEIDGMWLHLSTTEWFIETETI